MGVLRFELTATCNLKVVYKTTAQLSVYVRLCHTFMAGNHIISGGHTDVSISFVAVSYNFDTGEWNGIWNWKNLSTMERIGYGFGAFANLNDINNLINQTNETLYTQEKNPDGSKDLVSPDQNQIVDNVYYYSPAHSKPKLITDLSVDKSLFIPNGGKYGRYALRLIANSMQGNIMTVYFKKPKIRKDFY